MYIFCIYYDVSIADEQPSWTGLAPCTVMGHVHLHVAHLDQAVDFYTDMLGCEWMASYGREAAFVSAGGYHHHLGLNTWAGVGATSPGPDDAALHWYEICLPDREALAPILQRLDDDSPRLWGAVSASPAQRPDEQRRRRYLQH